MRLLLFSLLLIVPALPAAAEKVRPMQASPSVSELQTACYNAEGSFSMSPDNKGYSCTKENCDGKGGNCTVACDNQQNCVGATPARLVNPTTLVGILQNGDMVVHDREITGSTSLSSPSSGGAAPADDSNPWPDGPLY